jgi:hypothetical protein
VPPFFILEDLLKKYKGKLRTLLDNQEEFDTQVLEGCEGRYKTIAVKIQRAVLRSFIFILFTKALFAVGIEGTYESLLFGEVLWGNIAINALVPPLLMVGTGIMIKPPTIENSKKILARIKSLLTEEQPKLGPHLELSKSGKKQRGFLDVVFGVLWLIAFGTSFGLIIWVLSKLQFNPISQVVFIFFVAVVSFLTYRINNTANEYTVEYKQGFITPIIDFFFMPIVHVGRHLSEGISQINILLFLLDFIIETPFKGIFGFFEQLFLYLHTKRENLG